MKLQKIFLIMISLILILGNVVYATDELGEGSTPNPTENIGEESNDDTQTPTEEGDNNEIQWPDFTNAKIEFESIVDGQINIIVANVPFDEKTFDYNWEITNTPTVPSDISNTFATGTGKLIISNFYIKNIYQKMDDMYLTVKMKHHMTNEEKIVMSAKKINRKEQNALGNRIKATISYTISASIIEPVGDNRNLNIKIGQVTDKNVLNSIKNKETSWRTSLLNYARNNDGIFTKTIPITNGLVTGAEYTGLNMQDKAYYYVYVEVDGENGKYYPIEDVYFAQAIVDKNGGKMLTTGYNFDDDTPTPAPTDTPKESNANDQTTAPGVLPKTGKGIGIVVAILLIIGSAIFAKTKYTKYKGI